MLKKLVIFTFLLIAGASAYIYWSYSTKRTLITPYPYTFSTSYDQEFMKNHASEIKEAENSMILIVGDRMGLSLNPYLKNLQEEFEGKLKTLPSIYNWSSENEGVFRTLYKLKKLKRMPSIIIYFGASSELFEQKFDVTDKKAILNNFKNFDDEKLISLIITFPWLSKIFYKDLKYFSMQKFSAYKNNLPAQQKLEEKEVSFKIFEYEIKEMIDLVKDKRSTLVFVTTPLNLEVEPKEVCSHSTFTDIVAIQQEIAGEIKEGFFKSAFPKALELSRVSVSNANSFHLLGKSALGLGDIKVAREALLNATVYDCHTWRGNAVYNAIIKQKASKNLVQVIDFDQYMSSQLSKEGLFFDDIFPQPLFYQNMVKELGVGLKKILNVNE
jgi:hypothetical protein